MTFAAESARRAIDMENLRRSMAFSKDVHLARKVGDAVADIFEQELQEGMSIVLMETLVAGGTVAARAINSRGSFRGAKKSVGARFDRTNPRAQQWADQRAGRLVTQVGGETRQAIREVMSRSIRESRPPAVAAREIRELVGLTRQQSEAVTGLRHRLENADGETVSAFGDRLKFKVPEGGASEEKIEQWAQKYSDSLLRWRAENIARTETMAAANEGQRELWEQSIDKGILDADAQREWIISEDERLCEICAEMEGQRVRVDEDFVLPDGDGVSGPPAHPQCRCAMGIA